jgi:hypothetical protein
MRTVLINIALAQLVNFDADVSIVDELACRCETNSNGPLTGFIWLAA